jgi:hypothetical protein
MNLSIDFANHTIMGDAHGVYKGNNQCRMRHAFEAAIEELNNSSMDDGTKLSEAKRIVKAAYVLNLYDNIF